MNSGRQFWIDVCGVVGMVGLFIIATAALSVIAGPMAMTASLGYFMAGLGAAAFAAFGIGANLKATAAAESNSFTLSPA